MTTTPEQDVTEDLAALQQLPEDDQAPDPGDPTCATTGVGARREPGADLEVETDSPDPQADSAADPNQGR